MISYNLKGPKRIQIHPTDRCNLNCKFCDEYRRVDKTEELADDTWREVLKDIDRLKPERLIVSGGGEPTIRREVLRHAMEVVGEEVYLSLITNGTLLGKDLVEEIVEGGINHITFSLHSPFAGQSDFLRQSNGAFSKTIETIEKINSLKEKESFSEPTISVAAVITKYNVGEVDEFIEFVRELGIEPLVLMEMYGEYEKFRPSEEELRSLKDKIEKDSLEIKIKTNFDQSENTGVYEKTETDEIPYCFSPFFEITVFPDGRTSPCCYMSAVEDYTENVRDMSLEEIWRGRTFEALRKGSVLDRMPEVCSGCLRGRRESSDLVSDFERLYESLSKGL